MYNKPQVNLQKERPDVILSATELITEFEKNEAEASVLYLDKIVQITGEINEISASKGNSVITLKNGSNEPAVICQMIPEENKRSLSLREGQQIVVRGICSGFLLDVMLVNCVIVNPQ